MKALTWKKALDEAYPVVIYLARKYIQKCNGYLEFQDLVNAGLIGLYDAFNKFDKSSKASFKTYARFRINGSIIDEIRNNATLSRRTFQKVKAYEDFVQEFQLLNGRNPTESEIENTLSHKIKDIKSASLGRANTNNELHSHDQVNVQTPIHDLEFIELMNKLKSLLPEKNYGMLLMKKLEGLSLKEIASVYNLSEARVSQLIKESIGILDMHLDVA